MKREQNVQRVSIAGDNVYNGKKQCLSSQNYKVFNLLNLLSSKTRDVCSAISDQVGVPRPRFDAFQQEHQRGSSAGR